MGLRVDLLVGHVVGPLVDLLAGLRVVLGVDLRVDQVGGYRFLRDLVDHDFLRHFDPDFDDYLETCLTLSLSPDWGHLVGLLVEPVDVHFSVALVVRCFPEL